MEVIKKCMCQSLTACGPFWEDFEIDELESVFLVTGFWIYGSFLCLKNKVLLVRVIKADNRHVK